MAARLGYPVAQQHYLAGFVRDPADRAQWRAIDAAADAARARGSPEVFIWASPQVARDGYIRFEAPEGEAMQGFDDIDFPIALGREASVTASFSTGIATTSAGAERRNSRWSDARLSFDVAPGIRSPADLDTLIAFFRARRGSARGFRFTDPSDNSSNGSNDTPSPADQLLGLGDGARTRFPLVKRYGDREAEQLRPITRPVAASVRVAVNGTETHAFSLDAGGVIVLAAAPAEGAEVRAGYRFAVPVRFAADRIESQRVTEGAVDLGPVELVMLREEPAA